MKKHRDSTENFRRMKADSELPEELTPDSLLSGVPQVALLTGACGFLGRHLLYELIRHTNLTLVCLVRDKAEASAKERLFRIISTIGISEQEFDARVEVLAGDITADLLGLNSDQYNELAGRVDVIYHCAALVDWVRNYRQLYRMNVTGVLAMIRLACRARLKRIMFVSSIAVCYSHEGPEHIDENTDMLPYVEGMPLGYAHSKCVAESLLRQAAGRGVPVTVLRPALIAGNSANGESSSTDLIAAIIQGCVATGRAIDTDWMLDIVPVDFVTRVMARVDQGGTKYLVLNLMHDRPRHWRELILWINLHGYPVRLVNSDAWIRHLFLDGHARGSLLYAQRRFFTGNKDGMASGKNTKPYEAYLAVGQRRIATDQTRAILNQYHLSEPPLDSDLLHSYFEYYRQAGVLPPLKESKNAVSLNRMLGGDWQLQQAGVWMHGWKEASRVRVGTHDGLLSEIATARVNGSAGIWQLHDKRKEISGNEPFRAVLKAKVSDLMIQNLTATMAGVCKPELGDLFHEYRDAIGLTGAQERELALYELDEPRLRRYIPACYGTLRDLDTERWGLLLEYMPEAEVSTSRQALWSGNTINTIIADLSDIHAIWYRREQELSAHPWLVATPDGAQMRELTPLWQELADFSGPWFESWCGTEIRDLQTDFIETLNVWWPTLRAMPATLIHNDFNPRNMVLRKAEDHDRLCVYDWELATMGVPQHDLAELLCFTLRPEMTSSDLDAFVDLHRNFLSKASNHEIDPTGWRTGFAFSLRYLLINRFTMYAMMNRFRPLKYLPGVMRNWMRLYAWTLGWT